MNGDYESVEKNYTVPSQTIGIISETVRFITYRMGLCKQEFKKSTQPSISAVQRARGVRVQRMVGCPNLCFFGSNAL